MQTQKFLELIEKIKSNTFTESKLDLYVEEFYEEGFEDRLDDKQGVILADALKQNTHITEVNLDGNNIGDITAIALASIKTLQSLNLTGNHIEFKGLIALAKSNLKKLAVDFIVKENPLEALEMTEAFIKNKTLESLDLTCSYLPTHLLGELIAKNTTIKTLGLPLGTRDEGLEFIGNNKTLKELYLRENRLTDKGAAYIGSNTNIEILRIDKSNITDTGAVFLTLLPALKKLSIYDSDITYKGAKVFIYSNLKEFSIHSGLKPYVLSCADANYINLAFRDVHDESDEAQLTKKVKVIQQDIDTTCHTEESPLLGEGEESFVSTD